MRLSLIVMLAMMTAKAMSEDMMIDQARQSSSGPICLDSEMPDVVDLDTYARDIGVQLHLLAPEDHAQAKVSQFDQGITNKLIKVSLDSKNVHFLIRIYGAGSHTLIDRTAEIRNIQMLSSHNLAPPLFGTLNNGLVYGYIPGTPCPLSGMSDPSVWPKIASHLARWHSIPIPASSPNQFLVTLDQWLSLAVNGTRGIPATDLVQIRLLLGSSLPASSLTFNHNDLLDGNIILQNNHQGHVDSVYFIDYEYSGIGPAAFDIANHFCEYAGFDGDYTRYPSVELQRHWIRTYLGARGVPNDQTVVDLWVDHVARYTVAAHYYWTLWALVQSSVSDIDFDYVQYANVRWNQMRRCLAQTVG